MRLLKTRTLELEEFPADSIPKYAILSHTWEHEEISFRDIQDLDSAKGKHGYKKIDGACRLASEKGFAYIWIDTCCIDKSSSAELQEAINSMYRWYAEAEMCYVYLCDVYKGESVQLDDKLVEQVLHFKQYPLRPLEPTREMLDRIPLISSFPNSKWFTRGWTLQELIAPRYMEFFDWEWKFVGRRTTLIRILSGITNVETAVLAHSTKMSSISIGKRMSWAAGRETTRVEDRAYSLLGIFGVNMPMLYGEGQRAFTRLQEEIMRISTDHSIFAWTGSSDGELLARSPDDFAYAGSTVVWGKPSAFEMTNQGLQIMLPVVKRERWHGYEEHLAVLNCREELTFDRSLALRLRKYRRSDEYYALHGDEHRRAQGRLESVRVSDFADCEMAPLRITRHFEPESSGVRFVLFVSSDYKIAEAYTTHGTWDQSRHILDTGPQVFVRGAVVLVSPAQQRYFLAFGFNWVDLRDRSDLSSAAQNHHTLRIRVIPASVAFDQDDFSRHWNYSTSCSHMQFPCAICSKLDFSGSSPFAKGMPLDFRHEMHPAGGESGTKFSDTTSRGGRHHLSASISKQEPMGETVFTVVISRASSLRLPFSDSMDGVFELEAGVPENIPRVEPIVINGNSTPSMLNIDDDQSLTWHPKRPRRY